jgi:hypothetical protein
MPQSRADSPEIIYDTLVDDEEFSSLIGEYAFVAAKAKKPSVSILSPNESLPRLLSQSGLEVIIHDVGQVTRMDYLTNQSDALISWKVYLIAWPPATGLTITNAASRMIEIFSNATAIELNSVPNEAGALIQSVVLIPNNSAIMI